MTFPLSRKPSIPKFAPVSQPLAFERHAERAQLIEAGVLCPEAIGRIAAAESFDHLPTLRLAAAGIREAARMIAMRGSRRTDEAFVSEVPPLLAVSAAQKFARHDRTGALVFGCGIDRALRMSSDLAVKIACFRLRNRSTSKKRRVSDRNGSQKLDGSWKWRCASR